MFSLGFASWISHYHLPTQAWEIVVPSSPGKHFAWCSLQVCVGLKFWSTNFKTFPKMMDICLSVMINHIILVDDFFFLYLEPLWKWNTPLPIPVAALFFNFYVNFVSKQSVLRSYCNSQEYKFQCRYCFFLEHLPCSNTLKYIIPYCLNILEQTWGYSFALSIMEGPSWHCRIIARER